MQSLPRLSSLFRFPPVLCRSSACHREPVALPASAVLAVWMANRPRTPALGAQRCRRQLCRAFVRRHPGSVECPRGRALGLLGESATYRFTTAVAAHLAAYQIVRERGYPGRRDHFGAMVARHRPHPAAGAYLRLRALPGEYWAVFHYFPGAKARVRKTLCHVGRRHGPRGASPLQVRRQPRERCLRALDPGHARRGGQIEARHLIQRVTPGTIGRALVDCRGELLHGNQPFVVPAEDTPAPAYFARLSLPLPRGNGPSVCSTDSIR